MEKEKRKSEINGQLVVVLRSADEVISNLDSRIDTTNQNTVLLIRILSEKSWTAYELSLLVLEYPSFDTRGATGDKLADNLWGKLFSFKCRYSRNAFDIWKKEWFVPGTIADPKVRQAIIHREKFFGPIVKGGQRRLRGERSLRDLMFEILSKRGPIEQRELVFNIKKHTDYHGMHTDHFALRKAVGQALHNGSKGERRRRLFKKDDRGFRLVRWDVISRVSPPPVRTKPQTETLSLLMLHFGRKKDWTVAELAKLAMQPGSGYVLPLSATRESVMENIGQRLRGNKKTLFLRTKGPSGTHWRLKKQQPVKISLNDRLGAIDVLSKGIGFAHMIEILSLKHPGLNWPTIKRLYDPLGPFSINKLEGASKDVIELARDKLMAAYNHSIRQVERINNDPRLVKKRLEAIARCSNSYKLKLLDGLEDLGIKVLFEDQWGWLRMADARVPDPDQSLLLKEKRQIVLEALNSLDDFERQIVELVIFDNRSISEVAAALGRSRGEIDLIFDFVRKKLSTSQLRELL